MKVNKYFTRLEKAFKQTQRELQKTIEAFYFRYAEENGLTYAAAQQKLDKMELGELQDFIELSMKHIGEYNQEVSNLSIKARITRYQALEAQIDAMLRKLYAVNYQAESEKTMQEVYEDTYYQTWYNIDQYRGFHSAFAQVDPATVETLLEYPFNGADFSSRLWKQKDHLQTVLMESVTTMLVQGIPPQNIAGDVAKKMKTKVFDAYRLLHTESSFLMSEATHAGYREDGVEKYQILATLDSKTCGVCGDLDGNVYTEDEAVVGKNMPPFHCFCRCTDVPYYDDMDLSDLTRAARDPETGETYEVPADMTYKEWRNLQKRIKNSLEDYEKRDTIVDIKFVSEKSNAEVRKDKMTVIEAYSKLPPKVQKSLSDITISLGHPGSACDYENGIVYIAANAEKQDAAHEFGHLIEHRLMDKSDVDQYKKYLVDGLGRSAISVKPYYNDAGHKVNILVVEGPRFVSEYQGRIYASSIKDALNNDGSINTDLLLEVISEPFRIYQSDKDALKQHKEVFNLIEGAVL